MRTRELSDEGNERVPDMGENPFLGLPKEENLAYLVLGCSGSIGCDDKKKGAYAWFAPVFEDKMRALLAGKGGSADELLHPGMKLEKIYGFDFYRPFEDIVQKADAAKKAGGPTIYIPLDNDYNEILGTTSLRTEELSPACIARIAVRLSYLYNKHEEASQCPSNPG